MRKIYLKLNKDPKDLLDLMTQLFSYDNHAWKFKMSVTTYFDKECTVEQCSEGKRRGLPDLLIIANTYFENVEIKELFETLLSVGDKNLYFYPYACQEINQMSIIFKYDYPLFEKYHGNFIWTQKLNGEYNMEELCQMIGVNSFTEMNKYSQELKEKLLVTEK